MEITGNSISINYSGRTDAGVHALSQVFDFETNLKREDNNWIKGINSNLPNTISVKEIHNVPDSFNSRFSAINRNYSYVIYNSSCKQLFFDKYFRFSQVEILFELMLTASRRFCNLHTVFEQVFGR